MLKTLWNQTNAPKFDWIPNISCVCARFFSLLFVPFCTFFGNKVNGTQSPFERPPMIFNEHWILLRSQWMLAISFFDFLSLTVWFDFLVALQPRNGEKYSYCIIFGYLVDARVYRFWYCKGFLPFISFHSIVNCGTIDPSDTKADSERESVERVAMCV